MNQIKQSTKVTVKNHSGFNSQYKKALDLYSSGDLKGALDLTESCLLKNNCFAEAHNLRGKILHAQGKISESIEAFQNAASFEPKKAEYSYFIALALRDLGKFQESYNQLLDTIKLDPENPTYLNDAGLICLALGKRQKAKEHFSQGLEIDPNNVPILCNIAYHCFQDKLLNEAINFSEKAIRLDPQRQEPYKTLGSALIMGNFYEKGIEYFYKSLERADEKTAEITHQAILMNLLYADHIEGKEIFLEHKAWADKYLAKGVFQNSQIPDPNKKLKVGFVSSDFRNHAVSNFLIPIFENYNKNEFEYYCYSGVRIADLITDKLKACVDVWQDIRPLSDDEILKTIKNDKIDILIDLAGHSNDGYLKIFGYKPAPLQFTYLGYPFSSGLQNMDYRITDEIADPTGLTEVIHSEKLARIEPCFLCYKSFNSVPDITNAPVLQNNYVTFGSFNNLAKISSSTIAIWSAILKNVPNSKLMLKSSSGMSGLQKEHIVAQFYSHGVSLKQLIFTEFSADYVEHLSSYNKIDICLDTFPYNGTTTTFEAFSMGVLVITLSGYTHHSRVGNSLLNALNLSELVASTPEEYIKIAVELANSPEKIQQYKLTLRNTLNSSVLTDDKAFSNKFGDLLNNCWQTYARNYQK